MKLIKFIIIINLSIILFILSFLVGYICYKSDIVNINKWNSSIDLNLMESGVSRMD